MKRKLLFAATLVAGLLGGISTASAQENIIKDWDGGSNTGSPATFGWVSSNRSWGNQDATSGIRFTTTYSGYKLENGSAYNYSANSELSSKILWIRYANANNEYYTYTFKGLNAGETYVFTGLVGWHNNDSNPTFTIEIQGKETIATIEKNIKAKTTLYAVSQEFTVPADDDSEEFVLKFTGTYDGTANNDCMEALSALAIYSKLDMVKKELSDAITAATAKVHTANIGTGTFQIPENAVNTFKAAVEKAEQVESTDIKVLQDAIEELQSAIATYEQTEIYEPTAERYTLQNAATNWGDFTRNGVNWSGFTGAYLTFIKDGRKDQGNYAVSIGIENNNKTVTGYTLNPAYAQAFAFTKSNEGVNRYYISQTDDDGTVRYLTTGEKGYSTGSHQQIRTTTDETKAYAFTIVPTTTEEGVYNIYVADAGMNIDFQDNGAYAANYGHANFKIVEAEKASVSINIEAGKYATAIFPFAPELPEDVVAKTIESIGDDGTITLVDATPVANVPYILYSEEGYTGDALTGFGTAKQGTYTSGSLTGVYTKSAVPATNTYVLQTQGELQAFYKVPEEGTLTAVPYRAYLTYVNPGVKSLNFGTNGEATAIEAVPEVAEGAENAVIYNLAGQRVINPTKGGIYIVNGQKVLVK